jgi:hypothetical protein
VRIVKLRCVRIVSVIFFLLECVSAPGQSYRIFQTFHGRFHCNGQWTEFDLHISPSPAATSPLGITDPDNPSVIGTMAFFFYNSVVSGGGGGYSLQGTHDAKSGQFHLEPKAWYSQHPSGFEMYGIEGTFDPSTLLFNAKMLSPNCDKVELVPPGQALAKLPDQNPAPNPATAPDSKRPERSPTPTNVTNYLDPASYSPDFEYWVTAWSDPPNTIHNGSPIDESVAELTKQKFLCVGSSHVTWDASGIKGTAPDQLSGTERFVIECIGDCKNVFYRPYVGANVTHLGLTAPLPTMQIKNVSLGNTSFRWNFSRKSATQPPPQIYIHTWSPLVGYGPFDPVPAEIARRQAAAPACRAPQNR